MKVIKSRENTMVEATLAFEVENDVMCDESYEFPE